MEYNLVKLEELRRVTPTAGDDDLILLSNLTNGAYVSTHMTVLDAFSTPNIRLDIGGGDDGGGFLAGIRKLRDTSCIDLIIDEDSLRTQKDANQAILDIFNTFGSHICELEDAVTEPFVIIDPNAPDTTDLEDGWMWADSSSGYSGYDLYVLDNGVWVPVSSASEGEKGEDGKSAYEIWLEQGNTGTEQDFLDSLRGEAATVDVGSTTTVEPDQPAKVTNSGDEFNAILDFEIPKGEKGDVGPSKVDLEYTKFVDMGLMTPKRGTRKSWHSSNHS